jgi:hypothetical protein
MICASSWTCFEQLAAFMSTASPDALLESHRAEPPLWSFRRLSVASYFFAQPTDHTDSAIDNRNDSPSLQTQQGDVASSLEEQHHVRPNSTDTDCGWGHYVDPGLLERRELCENPCSSDNMMDTVCSDVSEDGLVCSEAYSATSGEGGVAAAAAPGPQTDCAPDDSPHGIYIGDMLVDTSGGDTAFLATSWADWDQSLIMQDGLLADDPHWMDKSSDKSSDKSTNNPRKSTTLHQKQPQLETAAAAPAETTATNVTPPVETFFFRWVGRGSWCPNWLPFHV